MNFDLTKNAFALLATTPRADRTQIDDAFHDALLSTDAHEDETVLNRAQQSLISPRDRLENELSYFIDTKPATIHKIVAALQNGEAAHFIDDLVGLDRANLLAHLCCVGHIDGRRKAALELVEVHGEMNPSDVGEAIIAVRSISGFGTIEMSALLSGLKRLRQHHAKAVVAGLGSGDLGQADIADLAGTLQASSPARQSFLEVILNEYESELGPALERAAARVQQILDQIVKDPNESKLHASFKEALGAWDHIVQPLQIADQVRGIDEHHSRQLFESIRDVCLELANERELYRSSLYLSQLARDVFSELPDAAKKLSEDVTQLSELADWSEKQNCLTPLVNAIAIAEENHRGTWKALRKSGFQTNAYTKLR
jgi:hypothetical protein